MEPCHQGGELKLKIFTVFSWESPGGKGVAKEPLLCLMNPRCPGNVGSGLGLTPHWVGPVGLHCPASGNSAKMTTCRVTSGLSPSQLGQLSHWGKSPDMGWGSKSGCLTFCWDSLWGNWPRFTEASSTRKKVSLSCIWAQRPCPQKPQQKSPCFLSQLQLPHMTVAVSPPLLEGCQQLMPNYQAEEITNTGTEGTCPFQERDQTEWSEDVDKLRQNSWETQKGNSIKRQWGGKKPQWEL